MRAPLHLPSNNLPEVQQTDYTPAIMAKRTATKAEATATTKTDPVLALAEYFLSADHMHTLTHAIREK
jgi:hypothetical protein